eukprot:TRINITY_DN10689_c0_g1_i2.p1 TRINITY_DN10689_c0_g1~~TRINITY_DN10689_c0_g1_i2.p1  ORF type:complete len:587 (-),score=69.86 TRINITY_DN10689_c0_g1_i2:182-1942(-)
MRSVRVFVVWFRTDLRLHDHEPLHLVVKEAQAGDKLLPIYCFDPRQFAPSFGLTRKLLSNGSTEGQPEGLGLIPKTGPHRSRFLLEAIQDLHTSLKRLGSGLCLRSGKPEEVLPAIMSELSGEGVQFKLYYHGDVCPEELSVEEALRVNLRRTPFALSVQEKVLWGGKTMYHPSDLPFQRWGGLPWVYSDFRRMIETSSILPRPPLPPPSVLPPLPSLKLHPDDFTEYESSKGNPFDVIFPSLVIEMARKASSPDRRTALGHFGRGGETAGLARLRYYFWTTNGITNYKITRNGLVGSEYSTKFSPWLALGCLSVRLVESERRQYERERQKNESTYWVWFELLWRDYFIFLARQVGSRLFQPYGLSFLPQRSNIQGPLSRGTGKIEQEMRNVQKPVGMLPQLQGWKSAGDDQVEIRRRFEGWREGGTGLPFLDSCMRELEKTGWMSNRGRQNAASFLRWELGLDWRLGAEWFESTLIDYEAACNWGNWLYVAGVGTDPREGRKFDVLGQGMRYDPQAEFIRLWLPELEEEVKKYLRGKVGADGELKRLLHQPWIVRELNYHPFLVPMPQQLERSGGGRGRGRGRGR